MTYFELVGSSDKFTAIPEAARRLDGGDVGKCSDKKCEPTNEVVNFIIVFHP
jgi:hypothetical protein